MNLEKLKEVFKTFIQEKLYQSYDDGEKQVFQNIAEEDAEYYFNEFLYTSEELFIGDRFSFKNEVTRTSSGKEYEIIEKNESQDNLTEYTFYNDRGQIQHLYSLDNIEIIGRWA